MKRAVSLQIAFTIGVLLAAIAGSVIRAAEPIPLRAGPLAMVFDADNAFLRYVKVGPHDVLQGVNAPVRDRNWGTVQPKVSNLRVDDQGDHFTVAFDAVCQQGDIDFRWRGTIVGTQAGEVVFTFDGEAHSTFLRNRIGMCVLHAATAAGKPWIIRHVNGNESQGSFPTHISPHQPAKQIRGVSHEVADKLWAHVDMEGEVFEMEDQRNWTDASFKTYCTPLELPFPVVVKKGTKISHKVRIRVDGELPDAKALAAAAADRPIVLTLGERRAKLPRIGLQISSEAKEFSKFQLGRLQELRLDHLRVDLHPALEGWTEKLRQADRQSRALGVPLLVGIRLGERAEEEMRNVARELKALSPRVALCFVHVSDWRQFQPARETLSQIDGIGPSRRTKEAWLGAARGDNFVDLNRDRPNAEGLDVVAFAINPQIHAFDDASIVETLPMHAETVRSARQFIGERSLAVGPITLRPPPAGAAKDSRESGKLLPADVDARQASPFLAAWTLGSLSYLADAGAETVTYYETVGSKGVIDLKAGAERPAGFPAATGEVFPVYHVFREVADFKAGEVRRLESSDPLSAIALALQNGDSMRVLAANVTGRPKVVVLKGLKVPTKVSLLFGGDPAKRLESPEVLGSLDDAELKMTLPPHTVVRVEYASDG